MRGYICIDVEYIFRIDYELFLLRKTLYVIGPKLSIRFGPKYNQEIRVNLPKY